MNIIRTWHVTCVVCIRRNSIVEACNPAHGKKLPAISAQRPHDVRIGEFSPRATLLDWLRLQERSTGTKEGCAEGDCGACAVVVVRERDGRMVYEPVNSCITLLGQLDGAELITVEDLADGGVLHPVQEAMARQHGSQCGFCTPGIVMSLFAHYHECDGATEPRKNQRRAGRQSVPLHRLPADRRRGARGLQAAPTTASAARRRRGLQALRALDDNTDLFVGDETAFFAAPASEQSLAQLYAQYPDATIVAGATDVGLWITKRLTPLAKDHSRRPRRRARARSRRPPTATRSARSFRWRAPRPVLASIDPDIAEVLRRFGSIQVRACGTVGGNIANGSPIGDLAPMLIALGAIAGAAARRRNSPTAAGELLSRLTASRIARRANSCAGSWCRSCRRRRTSAPTRSPSAPTRTSRRCWRRFACRSRAARISDARVAFGGMAGIPKRAQSGRRESARAVARRRAAAGTRRLDAVSKDFTPLTDLRASAGYRSRVAGNLVIKALAEIAASARDVTRIADRRMVARCRRMTPCSRRRCAMSTSRCRTTAAPSTCKARPNISTTSRSRRARCMSRSAARRRRAERFAQHRSDRGAQLSRRRRRHHRGATFRARTTFRR